MLNSTRIDAIQYDENGIKNTRVYYQNEDNSIRESCFNERQKWFTSGDRGGLVIDGQTARFNSPIAATRWNDGTEVPSHA